MRFFYLFLQKRHRLSTCKSMEHWQCHTLIRLQSSCYLMSCYKTKAFSSSKSNPYFRVVRRWADVTANTTTSVSTVCMETIPRLIAKYLSAMCADYLLAAVDGFYYSKCKEREDLYQLYFYRQTSIKQSPSIKRTPIKIPTSSPLIYCKFDLYEAVISIKRMQSPFRIPNWLILFYFTSIKRSRS